MAKKKFCSECGKEKKDSKKQKARKFIAIQGLKALKTVGIEELIEETKDMCFECWSKRFKSYVKPFAEQLGKAVEGW